MCHQCKSNYSAVSHCISSIQSLDSSALPFDPSVAEVEYNCMLQLDLKQSSVSVAGVVGISGIIRGVF
jgi:hypothetical protein